MNRKATALSAFLLGLCLIGMSASAQKLYRWVDSHGVVHYGDRIPPEYANQDRSLLNQQGVTVGFERGALSDAELAERERFAVAEEAQKQREREAAQRDQMLLDTYLSVADIEELRDRRIELLQSQMQVTEQYLGNLRKRLQSLEREAERYAQRQGTDDPAALPEDLSLELSRTIASIDLYEENLERTRIEQDQLQEAFAMDIERFAELKGETL